MASYVSKKMLNHNSKKTVICNSRAEPIEGFVDDYAFLIRGLLDLYEACFDEDWLSWAADLQEKQNALFWDEEGGAFYSIGKNDEFLIMRLKDGIYTFLFIFQFINKFHHGIIIPH